MTRILIILVLGSILLSCTGQSEPNDSLLNKKINELKEKSTVELGPPSLVNSHETDSSHAYHYFKDSLSTDELVKLTYHQYPMVRVYSFLALKEKRFDKMSEIVFGHLTDTVRIMLSDYDVLWTETVADLIIYNAFYSVKAEKRDSLRDLIFFNYPNLGAFSHILSSCEGHEPYYERIKQINQDSVSMSSLMALASYKKEEDLDFLDSEIKKLDHLTWQFQVIEKYPHNRFQPILEEYRNEFETDTAKDPVELYYYALASFKNEWSNQTFTDLISAGPKDYYRSRDRLQEVMKATDKYDTILYNIIRGAAFRNLGEDTLNIDYFDYGSIHSWWQN